MNKCSSAPSKPRGDVPALLPSAACRANGQRTSAAASNDETDVFLMAQTAEGDTEAFTRLYERHFNTVVRFLAKRSAPEVPHADLAQEVFLRVWRSAGRFRRRSAVRTYLLAIAANVLREFIASPKPLQEKRLVRNASAMRCDYGCAYCPASTEVEMAACRRDLELAVAQRVANMPPRTRQAIELVILQKQGVHQAARTTGCSVETFQKRLRRAIKVLQGIFGPTDQRR